LHNALKKTQRESEKRREEKRGKERRCEEKKMDLERERPPQRECAQNNQTFIHII
jgi:hypothetical protein